ncbi:MAG: sensor histidine kinase [Alphaproteobacteria bacterium]
MRVRLRSAVKWLLTAGGVLVLGVGIGGSVLAGRTLSDQAYLLWLADAEQDARALTQVFDDLLTDGRTVVRALSTQVSRDDEELTTQEFRVGHEMAQDPNARFRPSESAYVQRVLRDRREDFEARTGQPMHQFGNGAAPALDAYEHFVVTVNTMDARLLTIGADLVGEAALRSAVTAAYRRPNEVIASPVFERGGRRWVALVERPVFPGQRVQNGLVVALIEFDPVIAHVRALSPDGLTLHMTQQTADPEQVSPTANVTTPPADGAVAAEVLSVRLPREESRWTFDWYVYERYAGGPSTALGSIVMFAGLLMTLLLGSLVTILTLNNASIRHRVKARTSELELARDEAESASRYKSEFLASVSHELRTPLNAIIGFSELIMSEVKGPIGQPRYSEYARDIHTSGRHLLGVINSIIDLSAIGSGEFPLNDEAVSLPETLDAVRRMVALGADRRGVELICDVPSQMPKLLADQIAIEQILLNLASNAVQFTPRGGTVTFSAGKAGDSIWMMVTDTGVGMDFTEQTRALQPFGQGVPPMNRVSDGAGLGLPIAKELAGRQGGVFELHSGPGQGTRIRIRFDPSRTLPSAAQAVA